MQSSGDHVLVYVTFVSPSTPSSHPHPLPHSTPSSPQLQPSPPTTPTIPQHADKEEIINAAVVLTFDALLVWMWGWRVLLYLALSVVLGGGLHPLAAHLIAEHYVFAEQQETYSCTCMGGKPVFDSDFRVWGTYPTL